MVETQALGAASHIIKRPRLTKILDETEARIILLCAPAGYGKTTLAREWVATRKEPVLWYSGGPAMADVAALAVDLAELFAGPESELVERVRFLASRGESARLLAKALSDSTSTSPVVVIDDYQFATAASDAEELIRELVASAERRWLIASRSRPRWASGRRVIYGEALVVTQRELAFTPEEAQAVLPSAEAVHAHARGWPAVIGLAAITGTVAPGAADLRPDELYDFLASDLLGSIEHDLRVALFQLGAGGDTSPDVAAELFGPAYTDIIDVAVSRGFVTRERHGWISMHPLLRHFLVRQLSELDRLSRGQLIGTILDVLETHEEWDACLSLLTSFPLPDRAAKILKTALEDLLAGGRTRTVARWVDVCVGSEVLQPIVLLAQAEVALRKGQYLEASQLAEEAARGLSGDLAARAHIAAGRAAHQTEDQIGASAHADAADRLAVNADLRTEALWLAFANAYERDPARTQAAYERLESVSNPRPEHTLRLACAEAFLLMGVGGNLRRALNAAQRAVAIAMVVRDPLLRTNALNLRAQLLRVCAEYQQALDAVPGLVEEAERAGLEFVVDHATLCTAGALVGIRQLGQARDTMRKLDARTVDTNDHLRGNLTMVKAKLRVAAGDLVGAALLLEDDEPLLPLALRAEFISLQGLIAAARGDSTLARKSIRNARTEPQYIEALITVEAARSILEARAPRRNAGAGDVVRRGLRLGAADIIVTACRAFPPFAALAVEDGAGPELQRLFNSSRDYDLGRRAGLKMPRELRRTAGLSPRECEVYELMIAGRTNLEIAHTLFISESTTKVHIRHIFEKLGVHSRAEAVAARVQLGPASN